MLYCNSVNVICNFLNYIEAIKYEFTSSVLSQIKLCVVIMDSLSYTNVLPSKIINLLWLMQFY